MKQKREELEKQLYISIEENLSDRRNIINKITEILLEKHNISPGKVKMLYNKNESIPIQTLPDAELYVFTKALYEVMGDGSLLPGNWFNPEEIKSYENYKTQQFYKGDVAIFHNVDQVSDKQWMCTKETWVDMTNKLNQGLIIYNIRTQRDTTPIVFGNIATAIPTIKQRPVKEMTELMLTNKFTPNTITLNIRNTGEEHFEYNAKERTLAVAIDNEKTFLDIPDGMHRTQAGARAVEKNSNLSLFTFINILNYTEDEVQEFIEQEDHRTPISKSHIASYKNDDDGVIMAKFINKYGSERINAMFNQFATNETELTSPYWKYVTIETFARAFDFNFKIEEPREFSKIQKFFINYFNELIGILKDRKIHENIGLQNNIYIGYIALASKIYDSDSWKATLEEVISKIDFEYLKSLGGYSNKRNSSVVKRISDYFKRLMSEVATNVI